MTKRRICTVGAQKHKIYELNGMDMCANIYIINCCAILKIFFMCVVYVSMSSFCCYVHNVYGKRCVNVKCGFFGKYVSFIDQTQAEGFFLRARTYIICCSREEHFDRRQHHHKTIISRLTVTTLWISFIKCPLVGCKNIERACQSCRFQCSNRCILHESCVECGAACMCS